MKAFVAMGALGIGLFMWTSLERAIALEPSEDPSVTPGANAKAPSEESSYARSSPGAQGAEKRLRRREVMGTTKTLLLRRLYEERSARSYSTVVASPAMVQVGIGVPDKQSAGGGCDSGCDWCWCGTEFENNCPIDWFYDDECDCGCQFCDAWCECSMQDCGSSPCAPACDFCWIGTQYQNNCPASWCDDGDCDCGCQWNDQDCGGPPCAGGGNCCDPPYSPGDRVQDSAGACGTVACCDLDDSSVPILVSWDGETGAGGCEQCQWCDNGDCCEYAVGSYAWARCDQIEIGCLCGNGVCAGAEDCENCPSDCGPTCGNGTCECDCGETQASCAQDCTAAPCATGLSVPICSGDVYGENGAMCVETFGSCVCEEWEWCDYCNNGNCDPAWNGDGECDCGCQFCDIDCPEYPECCITGPTPAEVCVDIKPGNCGSASCLVPPVCESVDPVCATSVWDPNEQKYLFCPTYTADSCVGDVCVRLSIDWPNEACDPELWWRFNQNPPSSCGNGVCQPNCGEDCTTCPQDCGTALVSSSPPCDGTLPRMLDNCIRLEFGGPITLPNPGQLEIRQLLPNGVYGSEMSDQFTFTVEGGNVLVIQELGQVFRNMNWYSVSNAGWPEVCEFEIDYVVVYGDVNNSGFTDFGDLSDCFGNMGLAGKCDRFDINSSGFVDFGDISDIYGYIQSFTPEKPSDHTCTPP